jgi:hypothetical protein
MIEYRVIDVDEAEAYEIGEVIWYPFEEFADDQEIHLYEGDLHIDGDFSSDHTVEWNPYNVIVDGDLDVTGSIDWADHGDGNFLVVTGNVFAGSLLLDGTCNLWIQGDLRVDNLILGANGDEEGMLIVDGDTAAPTIIDTAFFHMEFGGRVDGTIFRGIGASLEGGIATVEVESGDADLTDYFPEELIEAPDAVADGKIREWALAGKSIRVDQ